MFFDRSTRGAPVLTPIHVKAKLPAAATTSDRVQTNTCNGQTKLAAAEPSTGRVLRSVNPRRNCVHTNTCDCQAKLLIPSDCFHTNTCDFKTKLAASSDCVHTNTCDSQPELPVQQLLRTVFFDRSAQGVSVFTPIHVTVKPSCQLPQAAFTTIHVTVKPSC